MSEEVSVVTPELRNMVADVVGNISLQTFLGGHAREYGSEGRGAMAEHMADTQFAPTQRYKQEAIDGYNTYFAHELKSMDHAELAVKVRKTAREAKYSKAGIGAVEQLIEGVATGRKDRVVRGLQQVRDVTRDRGNGYEFNAASELRSGRNLMQTEVDAGRGGGWMTEHLHVVDQLITAVDGNDKGASFTAALMAEAKRMVASQGHAGTDGKPPRTGTGDGRSLY